MRKKERKKRENHINNAELVLANQSRQVPESNGGKRGGGEGYEKGEGEGKGSLRFVLYKLQASIARPRGRKRRRRGGEKKKNLPREGGVREGEKERKEKSKPPVIRKSSIKLSVSSLRQSPAWLRKRGRREKKIAGKEKSGGGEPKLV